MDFCRLNSREFVAEFVGSEFIFYILNNFRNNRRIIRIVYGEQNDLVFDLAK